MKKGEMSTARGAHSLPIYILLILILLGGTYYVTNQYVIFNVRLHDTGDTLYQRILHKDELITLHYIHSVTNQPVEEIFFVKDKSTMALKEMRYDSFGANLPVGPEQLANETTTFIKEDGYYKVIYENRSFDVIPLRVGQVVANHTLVFKDNDRVPLLDIAEGGSYIELFVSPVIF
ncbi:MAG: DUF1850 domain-containing protein [Bacillota bacterium]|nr:DUF1850 domain-containing protein [Bacillota bacterium]MDW7684812.1 DUF1850 domain-containing protein [Bacillota bacterium]